ncbi:MAG TPA: RNA polymerase sigma-70 factor [Bacteroidales bacterium]|nr:RNA polymerase sigma-70 factor [Bacteroidales bacterium]
MQITETKKLIRQLRKGNVSAFNLIFENYHQKIYNFCLQLLKKQQDAEEVTQEVFIALWQNRERMTLNTSLSTYIYSIARNQIYHIYRKSFYVQSYIEYLYHTDIKLEMLTEDQVLYNELQKFMNHAIEELPPKRKEVFKLSRMEGLTYKEIAGRMKISENTVDVQIRKALGFLKNTFKNYYMP